MNPTDGLYEMRTRAPASAYPTPPTSAAESFAVRHQQSQHDLKQDFNTLARSTSLAGGGHSRNPSSGTTAGMGTGRRLKGVHNVRMSMSSVKGKKRKWSVDVENYMVNNGECAVLDSFFLVFSNQWDQTC